MLEALIMRKHISKIFISVKSGLMKIVHVRDLASELNITEGSVLDEARKLISNLENSKTHYLLNTTPESEMQIFVVDSRDLEFLNAGSGKLCMMDLALHFNFSAKTMNWVLSELYNKGSIQKTVHESYIRVKNKPSVKATFESEKIVVGEKVTLNIEINTPCEIVEPNLKIEHVRGLELDEAPKLPNKIRKGKYVIRYQYEATIHGKRRVSIKFGGIIEGVEFGPEELATADLVIIPLSPEIMVSNIQSCYEAIYHEPFRLTMNISNRGAGAAQNILLEGLEKHSEFEVLEPTVMGVAAPHGTAQYKILLKPEKSGVYEIDDLKVQYEDLLGRAYSCDIPKFEVNVATLQPKLKVEILTPEQVKPNRAFSVTLQISNIGEGDAKNLAFSIPLDQSVIQSGTVKCSLGRLNSNETEKIHFVLRAPNENDITIPDFDIEMQDEEDKPITSKIFGSVVPVEKTGGTSMIRRKTPWPFMKNSVVGGQYQIIEEIGEGGFAKVYLVRRSRFREELALKALRSEFVSNTKIVDNFIEEAKIVRDLRERHIVNISYIDMENRDDVDFPYMVMEYLEGGTLGDRISPGEPLNLQVCVDVINDMCSALLFAHQHDIIHFDIKPSNIFYDEKKKLWKLGDFGLAKAVAVNDNMLPRGSFRYMAPEIKEGKKGSRKSDVYSLGKVFNEILTGDLDGNPRDLEKMLGPEWHRVVIALADIVEKMTNRNPADRPNLGEVQRMFKSLPTMPATSRRKRF